MPDSRTELGEIYREMSDEELLEWWIDGNLTEVAMGVARAEFARRGMQAPEAVSQDSADEAGSGDGNRTAQRQRAAPKRCPLH